MGAVGKSTFGGAGGSTQPQTGSETQTTQQSNLDNFQKMDTQSAAQLVNGLNRIYKAGYNDNYLQSLTETLQLHDKPTVRTDDDFDTRVKTEALGGVELYRGLGDQRNDTVVNSVKFGGITYQGYGVHGNGTYLTTDPRYARMYAGSNTKNTTFTAYIDKSKAKPITETALRQQFSKEPIAIQSQFSKGTNNDAIAMYALHKGYNVIHCPGGNGTKAFGKGRTRDGYQDFYVALTRDVLVIRDNTKVR